MSVNAVQRFWSALVASVTGARRPGTILWTRGNVARATTYSPPMVRTRRGGRAVVSLVFAAPIVIALLTGSSLGAQSGGADSGVDLQVEVGVGGVVGWTRVTPVRVTLTAERSTRQTLLVGESNSGSIWYSAEVEVSPSAPVSVVVPVGPTIGALSISYGSGPRAAEVTAPLQPDNSLAIVAAVPALSPPAADVPILGGFQTAHIVPFAALGEGAHAVLDGATQIVVAPTDLDRIAGDMSDRLTMFVERGGILTVDGPPVESVLGWTFDTALPRQPVAMGWVTFSEGKAAAGSWVDVVQPVTRSTWSDTSAGIIQAWNPTFYRSTRSRSMISTRWIVLVALGIPFVVGPLLWSILRNSRRRRLMWVISPVVTIAVAATIVLVGERVLDSSTTSAGFSGDVTSAGQIGDFATGVRAHSGEMDIAPGASVRLAQGPLRVSAGGGGAVANAVGGAERLGELLVSQLVLDDTPAVTLDAAIGDDEGTAIASVTVTNTGDAAVDIENAWIGTTVVVVGRRLAPGEDLSFEIRIPAPVPLDDPLNPNSEGRVFVDFVDSNRLVGVGLTSKVRRDEGFGEMTTHLRLFSAAATRPTDPASTADVADALRIDTMVAASDAVLPDFGGIGGKAQPIDPDIAVPGGVATTSLDVPDLAVDSERVVMVSSTADYPGGDCEVHSTLDGFSLFRNGRWEPLPTSAVHPGTAIAGNDVKNIVLPPIPAGHALFLRTQRGMGFGTLGNFIDCSTRVKG